ncbi:hypothetical protein ATCC90586_005079 [Pythium insidiosum]|nr:hypothetical protein ATCC90586_005079 [Pythium insidiosum]
MATASPIAWPVEGDDAQAREDEQEQSHRLSALQLPMLSLSSLPSEATEDGGWLDTTKATSEGDANEDAKAEAADEEEDDANERKDGDTPTHDADDAKQAPSTELRPAEALAERKDEPATDMSATMKDDGEHDVPRDLREITPRSDDLTVECASPRDIAGLDEQEAPSQPVPSAASVSPMVTATATVDASEPPPCAAAAKLAGYTVQSLFPIVYEPERAEDASVADAPAPPPTTEPAQRTAAQRRNRSGVDTKPQVATRLGQLQQENDRLQAALQALARTSKLRLQLVDSERQELAQRNTRLKSQLATLTTELTRCKAENAKLQTENELYAAKLPQLSAALSQESTQLDEKTAQGVSYQLEATQLRAKAQVLQTRNHSLDAQLQALQQSTRQLQSETRRKTIALQQADERLRKLESELAETRGSAAHELHHWKRRLQELTQRVERERRQRELEHRREIEKQLQGAKQTTRKLQQQQKETGTTVLTLRQELEHCRQQLEQREVDDRRRARELRAAETAICHAEKREAKLQSHLHRAKLQLRVLERQLVQTHSRAPSSSLRKQEQCDGIRDDCESLDRGREEEDPEATEWCSRCCGRPDNASASRVSTDTDCRRCAELLSALQLAESQLVELREGHAVELKLQATAYERALASLQSRQQQRVETSPCA